ncbi:hypothetical protein F5Y08DRAFT_274929 [Xylaria arbuscula]|nr:hypothetical protein F5Y08DRAFT_274929 [Xylaria arbuscula]
MSGVTYRDATAIVQLVFFLPYLVSGSYLCQKHGWSRSGGWLIVVIFSVLRLISASFQIATIWHPTRSVYSGALVTASIGVGPLVGISIGMLRRLNGHLPRQIPRLVFVLLFAASLTGIGIASGSSSITPPANSPSPFVPNALTKTAIIIFTVEYLVTGGLFFYILSNKQYLPGQEVRLLASVALSAPFVIIRLIYGLLASFSPDLRFNLLIGDTTLYFILSVLAEIIAVGISVVAGFILPVMPEPRTPTSRRKA